MSLIIATWISILFLCFSGYILFLFVEEELQDVKVRFILRFLFAFAAPLVVGYFAFGMILSIISMFVCVGLIIVFADFLKSIFSERKWQILLDLPYFDMKKRPVLSAGFLLVMYWAVVCFFIKSVID